MYYLFPSNTITLHCLIPSKHNYHALFLFSQNWNHLANLPVVHASTQKIKAWVPVSRNSIYPVEPLGISVYIHFESIPTLCPRTFYIQADIYFFITRTKFSSNACVCLYPLKHVCYTIPGYTRTVLITSATWRPWTVTYTKSYFLWTSNASS